MLPVDGAPSSFLCSKQPIPLKDPLKGSGLAFVEIDFLGDKVELAGGTSKNVRIGQSGFVPS